MPGSDPEWIFGKQHLTAFSCRFLPAAVFFLKFYDIIAFLRENHIEIL
jgi:hypothetical protein